MQDTELTPDLVKAIVRAPGEYRFFVPVKRRETVRDTIRRYAERAGAQATTRTADDTMWVVIT